MSSIRAAFFTKNLPMWERVLRVVLTLVAAAAAVLFAAPPWSWVLGASALGLGVTGMVGFCPACAMVGRRLDKASLNP